jgi:hypothetical protein
MIIVPIVRRTVTVRARQAFHFPFQCESCKLATTGHAWAEGVGRATMAYVSPDANVARQRALNAAYNTAIACFQSSPCPRCGGHSAAHRTALAVWQHKAESRKSARKWTLWAGLALSLVWSSGCGVWAAASGGDGSVGGGVMLTFMWMVLGAGAVGIVYALLGPGRPPALLSYIPQNVWFDPPDPSQVQGTYRGP